MVETAAARRGSMIAALLIPVFPLVPGHTWTPKVFRRMAFWIVLKGFGVLDHYKIYFGLQVAILVVH